MDLHLHTPASSDYQEPRVTYLDILQTAEARGLDIIAFADHNTVAGLRHLRDEIAELELLERLGRLRPEEQGRLSEYRRLLDKILLLPGFEFTATFGFHILGIFPPETTVRELEHLLLSLNVPKDQLDRGSVTVGASSDVLTAYRLISEAGGLAIAAHANSTNGVAMRGFSFGGQTKIAFTQDSHLAALEVTDLDQKGRRTTAAFFSGSKPEYPRRMHCIMGSDAHRLRRDPNNSKNYGVGDRATDVLIDEVSFEALKGLFQSSDFARIRPHIGRGAPQTEFDYVQQAREEGASIVLAFHESAAQRGGKLYAVVSDVCAMANTNGGTIYVGASEDPKQSPVGVPDAEAAQRELRSAIARMITPQLECTVDVQNSLGRKIIRVLVPRGEDPPYAVEESKIYVREEAETSLAVRDEIVQLVLRGRDTSAAPPAVAAAPAATPVPAAPQPATAEAQPPSQPPAPAAAPAGAAVPASGGLNPPRTGVEIVASEERDGVRYHTMRDLRNGSTVKNVTRASARKLWHYAISAKEAGELDPRHVTWQGDIGLWRKTTKAGAIRFDLVQREAGSLRVYYGVTEDGIHGGWRRLIEADDRLAAAPAAGDELATPLAAPANGAAPDETAAAAMVPFDEPENALELTGDVDQTAEAEAVSEQPAAPAKAAPRVRRSRGGATKKAAKKTTAQRAGTRAAKKTTPAASRSRRKSADSAE